MTATININKLRKGMFVDLSKSLFRNPFSKDKFLILSEKQIQKLLHSGIVYVTVDLSKSKEGASKSLEKPKEKPVEVSFLPVEADNIYNIGVSL